MSKLLSNRLKKILQLIIYKSQSALITSQLITDSIIVAYEALHTKKTRMKGKDGSMALKLDISKAYDKIQ